MRPRDSRLDRCLIPIMLVAGAAALVALFSGGCASMTTAEKAYIGASVADIATTAVGLQRGLEEQNPIMRGSSDGETLARSILINAAAYWLMHTWIDRHTTEMQRKYWRIVFAFRSPVVGWNLYQIAEAQ